MSANEGETPSPVRQVRQYEKDEAAAIALQTRYDDEVTAERLQEETQLEDEFEAATRAQDEALSEKMVKKLK